jgi:hypothetical protein
MKRPPRSWGRAKPSFFFFLLCAFCWRGANKGVVSFLCVFVRGGAVCFRSLRGILVFLAVRVVLFFGCLFIGAKRTIRRKGQCLWRWSRISRPFVGRWWGQIRLRRVVLLWKERWAVVSAVPSTNNALRHAAIFRLHGRMEKPILIVIGRGCNGVFRRSCRLSRLNPRDRPKMNIPPLHRCNLFAVSLSFVAFFLFVLVFLSRILRLGRRDSKGRRRSVFVRRRRAVGAASCLLVRDA